MTELKTEPKKDVEPATAAEQETLARHLSERVRSLLAGDAEERKVIEQRRPSKVLQLGILPPQPTPEEGSSSDEIARRSGAPPSTIGLDFLLRPDAKGQATLQLEAEFSFYVQRYPTYAQQREWWDPNMSLEDEESGEDEEEGASSTSRMRLKGIFERVDIKTDRIPVTLDINAAPEKVEQTLEVAIAASLGSVLTDADTVYPFQGSQTLPDSALDSEQAWKEAIRDAEGDARTRPLALPEAAISVSSRRVGDLLRIQATLENRTLAPLRGQQDQEKREEKGSKKPRELYRDLHLFNCRLRVYEQAGSFDQIRFAQAPEDFRYRATRQVWATGHNCVARRCVAAEDAAQPLTTETWPLYRQQQLVPRPDLEITFAELADDRSYREALARVWAEMKKFEGEWHQALGAWPDAASEGACRDALGDFREDMRCFELGMKCLSDDPRLARAFVEANEVFRRHGEKRRLPITSWRLFQLVYQVIQLAALRARETHEEELLAELDTVDVLWFPTGGGKTEAYLGLITTLLFYDRLRGKERGVAAILRFPLRMLSVQQLQRVLAVLWFAERRRREIQEAEGLMAGDPFALGYWVGSDNSPNTLTRAESQQKASISWWQKFIAAEPEEALKERILTRCPNPDCDGGKVELEADVDAVRLRHVCRSCGEELPVYVTDEEVYRYLPAMLVCTVDKLAHVARADHFTNIIAGPAYRCPKHGYFTWHQAVWGSGPTPTANDRCLAAGYCDVEAKDYELVGPTYDPSPALQVQDELHLLEEELGTFNAHYETLMEDVQRAFGSGRSAKLLAATATIEAYDEQVRQLYARRSRVFPSPGWTLARSFYTQTVDDARRLYVGALPYRPDPTEFGEKVQEMLHLEVTRMQDEPKAALAELGFSGRDGSWLLAQLFLYELSLGYVNRKQDGDRITGLLQGLSRRAGLADDLVVTMLSSENTLAEIADSLERIDTERPVTHERGERLRAIVATSIVSHGVDIDRLNLMVMNGMTPDTAGYIQASSRSGRLHVGLVIVGYDRRKSRDQSFYRYFLKYHEFIDRLIAPVPVNRFAKFAAKRTVPGVLSTLLIQVYGRQRLEAHGLDPRKPVVGSLVRADQLRRWWNSVDPPQDKKGELSARALSALGLDKRILERDVNGGYREQPVFDPGMVDSLRDDASQEIDAQIEIMQDFQRASRTPQLFLPEPLTSFRDVDEPTDFSISYTSSPIEDALTGVFGGRKDGQP